MRTLLPTLVAAATVTTLAPSTAHATPRSHGSTVTVTDDVYDVRTFIPVKKRAYDRVSKAETDIEQVAYTFERRVLTATITMREMYPRSVKDNAVLDWGLDGTVVMKDGTETRWYLLFAPDSAFAYYTDPDGDPRSSTSQRRCASTGAVNSRTDTVTLSVDFRSCLPGLTSVNVRTSAVGGSRYKQHNGQVYAPPNFKDGTDRIGFYA